MRIPPGVDRILGPAGARVTRPMAAGADTIRCVFVARWRLGCFDLDLVFNEAISLAASKRAGARLGLFCFVGICMGSELACSDCTSAGTER